MVASACAGKADRWQWKVLEEDNVEVWESTVQMTEVETIDGQMRNNVFVDNEAVDESFK